MLIFVQQKTPTFMGGEIKAVLVFFYVLKHALNIATLAKKRRIYATFYISKVQNKDTITPPA